MTTGPSLIITVTLASGAKTNHIYLSPPTPHEAQALVDNIITAVFQGFSGEQRVIALSDPTAIYNGNHVAAVSFSTVAGEAIDEALRRSSEAFGFGRLASN